jgi:catechol 2,3-dioxygenase-like lactoylglutathione lyase family enzyme
MERSLRFYRDLLGLKVRLDEMQPIGGMPTL